MDNFQILYRTLQRTIASQNKRLDDLERKMRAMERKSPKSSSTVNGDSQGANNGSPQADDIEL